MAMNEYTNKALIVDADPAVCETLAQTLKGAGYEPEVFLHPHSVITGLNNSSYSLGFIDVNLPDMSGVDLANLVRKTGKLEELILMGSNGSFEHAVRAVKLGAYDFLQKPFDSEELRMLLTRLRDRSRLQRRILEAERRHFNLIQNIPLLIFSLTPDFELEFINQACQPMLGFSPEEAMSAPGWFMDRVHPLDRSGLRDALQSSFTQAASSSLECRIMHKKGNEVHGIIRTMPELAGQNGGSAQAKDVCASIEGIFVDITDRVFLEKALVQNEKLKTLGAISSEMAHEVRNPLMSIAGFARRLEKKAPDMPEVGIILRESLRLERLLNRIRDYLKPVEARTRECSVNAVLGECLGLLYPEMNERGIGCQIEQLENAPMVMADPDYLSQVFINLIRNALVCLEHDASFKITSYASSETIHVEFRIPMSHGSGYNPEHLFMPFDEGGESFGLPLCYRLVKDMGGLLAFSQEGGADVFTLSLPKSNAEKEKKRRLGIDGYQTKEKYCFDEDTGALPRRRFDDLFARACRAGARDGNRLSLLIIDIDHFEKFSKKHGDAQAARCVTALGKAYTAALTNPAWLFSHYGAQEFLVLLPDTNLDQAIPVAERLRKMAQNIDLSQSCGMVPPDADEPPACITVSVGVVSFLPVHGDLAPDILAAASKALFLAKKQGRNKVYALSEAQSDEAPPAP